jgi:hypothetical protein
MLSFQKCSKFNLYRIQFFNKTSQTLLVKPRHVVNVDKMKGGLVKIASLLGCKFIFNMITLIAALLFPDM